MKINKIGIILLVISLILICIGCYLKIQDNLGNDKLSKISLDDIAKQYNNMDDLKTLKSTGASSKATVSKDTIIISYNNTKKTYKIVFKYKNGILTNEYKNNELNVIVSSIIYPNLLEAIAILDGYDEIEIGETVSQILNNKHKSDGYEMYFKNDTLYFKVDLSKKLKLYKSSKKYDENTFISMDDDDYNVLINNYKIYNMKIKDFKGENYNQVIFMFTITNMKKEKITGNLEISLYDINKNLLVTDTIDYKEFDMSYSNSSSLTIDLDNTNYSDIKYFKIKKEKTYE